MKRFRYAFKKPSNHDATQFAFSRPSARRLAQTEANKSGRSVTVQKKQASPPYAVLDEFTVEPKTGARSNPSRLPSLLTGATILKATRNAAGVVKAITVRLRDGLGADGQPKSKGRTNPARPWKVWGYRRKGGWKCLSPGFATRAAAVTARDKHRPTLAMPFIQVYDTKPTRTPV